MMKPDYGQDDQDDQPGPGGGHGPLSVEDGPEGQDGVGEEDDVPNIDPRDGSHFKVLS
jgi:hypothetical protein